MAKEDRITDKNFLSQMLAKSDKAEFLEFINENLDKIDKAVLFVGIPDGRELSLDVQAFGFKYAFELDGFIGMAITSLETIDGEDT